ncbi:MAG: ATPase [Oscillospiraceae bacterium]|nr:ATPase [Oscillospiraceae bacterium]
MGIEKMMYVNVVGFKDQLDEAINRCVKSGSFHIEEADRAIESEASGGADGSGSAGGAGGIEKSDISKLFSKLTDTNPYKNVLKKLLSIHFGKGYKLHKTEVPKDIENMSLEDIEKYINFASQQLEEINAERVECRQIMQERGHTLELLEHLKDLNVNLSDMFAMENIKIRFGKLPIENFPKLEFYQDELFQFIIYDTDAAYHWGIYFVPNEYAKKIDNIFNQLYFERIRIPDYISEEPESEITRLKQMIATSYERYTFVTNTREYFNEHNFKKINQIYCQLKFLYDSFLLRSKVVTIKDAFYLVGFVPLAEIGKLSKELEDLPSVEVVIRQPKQGDVFEPPTKLKNNRFSRPYTMFVEMYGLPSYGGFNPTSFVAVTYTIIFGIMFGDLGQGFIVSLLGALIYKKSKNPLGAILTRAGISSMFFGFMYGSLFGFEEALDPVYEAIGWGHKPIEVMHETNFILMAAIAIGITIILTTIMLNIVLQLKKKNYESALFSNNGIAGFVFFSALLAGFIIPLFADIKLMTLPYILCLIVLPVIVMFFREPLAAALKHEKFEMHGGVGDFIASNFFEVFEFMLGYATNTLSFIRIGGFVFSHAGMMSVVMLLAGAENGGANPIVVVLGNIFVIGMEGLIVGIQVLRLEFYEMFSRFYEGDGHKFSPVKVKYETAIE